MEAFRAALTHAKALAPLRICLGNVSVDMDSVVGSMALAYYYNLRSKEAPFVGVANCTQTFFPLKLDINSHLAEHGLADALAFWSQVDPAKLQEVALIDHNRLDNSQEVLLAPLVTRIVDHHVDTSPLYPRLQEKQVELIGSATTLVVEKLLAEYPSAIDAELAHFLQAPIVLDSYYFEPSLKESKWTDRDLAVYKRLEELGGQAKESGKVQFERLFNAITDVELNLKLGFPSLLVKDFKTYFLIKEGSLGVGVGTIHVPLQTMMDTFGLPEMQNAMDVLLAERKTLAFYCILTNCRVGDTYRKELLAYRPALHDGDSFEAFVACLDGHPGFNLTNRRDLSTPGSRIVAWEVGNTRYSRKDFEKVMTEFYHRM